MECQYSRNMGILQSTLVGATWTFQGMRRPTVLVLHGKTRLLRRHSYLTLIAGIRFVRKKWQENGIVKLHLMKPMLGGWARQRECFCEVVPCRLRIGPHALLSSTWTYQNGKTLKKSILNLHPQLLLSDNAVIPHEIVLNFLKQIGILHRL